MPAARLSLLLHHRNLTGRSTVGWRKLGSKQLRQGPFLSLQRDRVLRPDGSISTYEHVVVHDTVRTVALDGRGHVLLVEDDFYLQRRRMLHLPGGGTDGEAPTVAGQRELLEETGRVAERIDHLATLDPLPGATAARLHLLVATGLAPSADAVHRDATVVGMTAMWWPLGEAVTAARTGQITDAGSVAGVLLAVEAETAVPRSDQRA
ncbi:NUDIX domain-containing protein [Streptomyces sp. NPDC007126]|uniref:NUDIX domain-containing protein n=1 Tax=Streptomyces sp. NPDC007126 TaxID=3364774 RepID=UPI0036757FFF